MSLWGFNSFRGSTQWMGERTWWWGSKSLLSSMSLQGVVRHGCWILSQFGVLRLYGKILNVSWVLSLVGVVSHFGFVLSLCLVLSFG